MRGGLGPDGANALALGCTAVANTQANRRYTFGVRGRHRLLAQHMAGAVVFVLALALTDGALRLLQAIDPRPGRAIEVIVLVLASGVAAVTRYVALRAWVFARSRNRARTLQPAVRAD
jgi:putative flippase GtrA